MRYLITENNIKWDNQYKNVVAFANDTERDTFVDTNLQSNWQETLQNQPRVHTMDLGNIDGTIEVEWKTNDMNIRNKNTIILQENVKAQPTFWWIESVDNLENNNMFELRLRKNIFLTYTGVIQGMEYFNLVEGHVPVDSYVNYEFNGGKKILQDIEVLRAEKAPKGIGTKEATWSNQWAIVYRKLKSGEEGARLRFKTHRRSIDGTSGVVNTDRLAVLPYKIFAAPVIDRGNGNIGDGLTASIANLTRFYNEDSNDGLTYAFKIVNFEMDTINNEIVQYTNSQDSSIKFIEIKTLDLSGVLNWKGENETNEQSHTLRIPSTVTSVLELLDGMNEYSLSVEGVRDFGIPLEYIKEVNGEYQINFNKFIAPTPNDTKEGIFFQGANIRPEGLGDYVWTNETELAVYVNQLNEYRANNPNSILEEGLGIGKATAVGATAGSIVPGLGTAVGAAVGGGVALASSLGGNILRRNSQKKSPESVKGDAATYFAMTSTFAFQAFVMKRYEYKGNERKALLDIVYRNGLQLENSYIVQNFNDIQRPKFNYLLVSNFREANTLDLPLEVIDEFELFLASGIRVWHNGYKAYDSKWADNGEGIDDFVKSIRG